MPEFQDKVEFKNAESVRESDMALWVIVDRRFGERRVICQLHQIWNQG